MQEDGTAPADAFFATATGWIVNNAASAQMANFIPNTEVPAVNFSATLAPVALGTGASANAFRSPNAYRGTFVGGDWSLLMINRSITAAMGSAQIGRIRWRVFASVNADGTGARELTFAVVLSNAVAGTGNTTANHAVRNALWVAPDITLINEYLFFACAFEMTTGGGSGATRKADIRENTDSKIVTTDFVPAVPSLLMSVDVRTGSLIRR